MVNNLYIKSVFFSCRKQRGLILQEGWVVSFMFLVTYILN